MSTGLVLATLAAALAGCFGKTEAELIAEGNAALQRGEAAQSMVLLRAALDANPDAAQARFLLGKALLATAQPGLAVIELQKAADLKHDPNLVLPALAEGLMASGQPQKVAALAGAGLSDPGARAALLAAQAAALLFEGKLAEGRAAVDAALKLDAASAPATMLHVRLLAGEGKLEQAFAALDRLQAAQPRFAEAPALRGDLLWVQRGDAAAATAALKAALALDPALLSAHTSLIGLHLQQRDQAAFRAQLQALQQAHPNHAETQFYTARALLLDRDFVKAREAVQRLLLVTPDNPYVLQLAGAIEFEAGAMGVAETRLSKALGLRPEFSTARRLLAEVQLRHGDADKVLQTLQPLLAAQPPQAAALLLAGQAMLLARNPQQASVLFAAAAKADPQDQKANTALGLAQIAQGRRDAGFSLLEEAAHADRGSQADLALYGARSLAGDLGAALEAAQALERKLPDQPLAAMLQGQVLVQQNKLSEARERFEKALSLAPANGQAVLALTALDQDAGKLADAQRRLEAFLKSNPHHLQASMGLAELKLQQGVKPDEVLALLAEAARRHPGEIGPQVVQINMLLQQRRVDAAVAAAQAALSTFPDHPQALGSLARAQLAAGATEQALATLRKLTAVLPTDARAQVQLGSAYLAARNLRLAEQSFRRAAELDPGLREASAGLVQVALQDKRPEDALKAARNLQRARPAEVVGLLMEGEIHLGRRAWDAAGEAFRAALARRDTAAVAQWVYTADLRAGRLAQAEQFGDRRMQNSPADAEFLHFLALQAIERKDWPAAERRLRALQTLLPDNPSAPNNLAWVLLQQGKPGALELARRANQLLPDNAGLLDTLGMAHAAEKQWPDAVATQRKAAALAPAQPELQLRLGEYLARSGDRSAARTVLQPLAAEGGAVQAQARSLLQAL